MTVIIVIAIIYTVVFLLPRVMPRIIAWLIRRKLGKMFDTSAFGPKTAAGRSDERYSAPGRNTRRKKIDPSVGEYIDFTESDTPMPCPTSKAKIKTESQITDIEWEEI